MLAAAESACFDLCMYQCVLLHCPICRYIKTKINLGQCKIRGKLSPVIRKVLSSKNYLGTLERAIFQLNEWRKFVKLDDVGNILASFFNDEQNTVFWKISHL